MKIRKHFEVNEYTTRIGYSKTISTYSSVYLFSLWVNSRLTHFTSSWADFIQFVFTCISGVQGPQLLGLYAMLFYANLIFLHSIFYRFDILPMLMWIDAAHQHRGHREVVATGWMTTLGDDLTDTMGKSSEVYPFYYIDQIDASGSPLNI